MKNVLCIFTNHETKLISNGNGLLTSVSNTLQQKERWLQLTNVNDVSLFVQHDVAIMPVFNLEQKQEKAICSHTADKIIASLYK